MYTTFDETRGLSPPMESRILSVLLFICVAHYASARCRDNLASSQSGCSNGHYTAPEINSVVTGTATNLAKATVQHGDALVDSMKALVGGVIGLLPGGAFVSGLFSAIGNVIGGGDDPVQVLANMYNELVQEIENLRNYVDDRIEQTNLEWVKRQLGDASGGLMAVARTIVDIDGRDLDELEGELDDLYDALILNYYQFAPPTTDTAIASFERTLPLFRQFADLILTTMVSEIAVKKLLCKDDDAASKTTALQERITIMEQHYTAATAAIIADHSSLESYTCCKSSMWLGWWAFAKLAYYLGECTTDMDESTCKTRYEVGCDYSGVTSNVDGLNKAFNWAKGDIESARSSFVSTRTSELTVYWERELKDAVDNWKRISSESAKIQNAYLK